MPNRPSGLDDVLKILMKNNISVEYMYSFNYSPDNNALIILRLSGDDNADELLLKNGIKVLNQNEINDI